MKLNPIVLALALTPLVGCGGSGGDDGTTSSSSTYSVKAVDGYLRGAQVWLDTTPNFKLDEGEPSAFSGEGGVAELDVTGIANPEAYSVIVKAIAGKTVDEDSITATNTEGAVITTPYLLSAPAGETVVTPLSTLVNIKMSNSEGQGLDAAEIKEAALIELAADLGIEKSQLLGDYIEDGQGDVAAKANAIVELEVLPESESEMETMSDDDTSLDAELDLNVATVKILTEDERLVETSSGVFEPVEIPNSEADDYDVNAPGSDKDDDGVINIQDAFPADATEWSDFDEDGTGDNADTDDDDDDALDSVDAFPYDKSETLDTDGDGTGNNADTDDDNDTVLDVNDAFALDATESLDTDGDGTGNNADTDDDNDTVLDINDAFPLDATETLDTDGDGTGNNADTDDDNDGVLDTNDDLPFDATDSVDTDGDKIGNNADTDDDGDGYSDIDETAASTNPLVKNEVPADNDSDFISDFTDTDDDNDGVLDVDDAFKFDANETTDTDGDGVGDNADKFPSDATETTDTDGDGVGDNKDPDADGDGVLDTPLFGTWSNAEISFTFNGNMTYSMEQKVADDEASDSTTGTETGTYAYDKDTGAITVSDLTDNNGTSGLSDMLKGSLSFRLSAADPSGNNLTFAYVDGDEQGTFVLYKTLATKASDYITATPNFAFIKYEDEVFGYDDVTWNSADNSLTTNIYRFNTDTSDFELATDNHADYVLTSTTDWGYEDKGDETLTPHSSGSIIYRDNYEEITSTGEEWILSGANILQLHESAGVKEAILTLLDNSVTFSEGASVYEMKSVRSSTPVYSLWLGSCNQPQGYPDLPMKPVADTELCNTQYSTTDGSAIENIEQITASESFGAETELNLFTGMHLDNYTIRLVADGSVDLYSLYVDANGAKLQKVDGNVTWQEVSVNGETLITFSTEEAELSNFNYLFLTEIGGYVRIGNRWDDGDDGVEFMFNEIAKQDIVDAIAAGNSDNDSTSDQTQFLFSTDWLNGKTLYNVYEEQNNEGKSYWETSQFTFTDSKVSGFEISNPDDKMGPTEYQITEEGYLTFTFPGESASYIKAFSVNSDYLQLIWTDTEHMEQSLTATSTSNNEFFFYDLGAAEKYVADNPF